MCWESYNKPIKQIATEDMVVYKVMDQDILDDRSAFSLPRGFHYNFGVVYSVPKLKIWTIVMDTGQSLINSSGYSYGEVRYEIYEGFHSFAHLNLAENFCRNYITWFLKPRFYICIIPKGAEYYDNDGELVSNRILIKKEAPLYAI